MLNLFKRKNKIKELEARILVLESNVTHLKEIKISNLLGKDILRSIKVEKASIDDIK